MMSNMANASNQHRPHPGGKVIGAVDPAAVDRVTETLVRAGFDATSVEIITVADVADVSAPLDHAGLPGFLGRVFLSLGDDLDELERARQEVAAGHVLLAVRVTEDEEKHRARAILESHGGHSIRYFGHWTVTAFD